MSTKSRRWVKVWHEIMTDTKFHDMPLEQQARWFNLLVYVSCHGDNGTAVIIPPARLLVSQLQCHTFEEMMQKIGELVNVNIAENSHAEISVTFPNWDKYQVDSTASDRKRRQRKTQKVTLQEKEKEKEKEKEEYARHFELFWNVYPAREGVKTGKKEAWFFFLDIPVGDLFLMDQAVENFASAKLKNNFGIPDPVRFIIKGRGQKFEPWRDWIYPDKKEAEKIVPGYKKSLPKE